MNLNGSLAGTRARATRALSLSVCAVCALAALIGFGCSNGTSTASQFVSYGVNAYLPAPGTTQQNGQVTLFVGSTYLAANMSYGQVGSSGNPVSLTSGTYNVYASLFNSNTTFSELPSQTFNGNNSPYSIVAAGEAGQAGALKPQIIVMQNYTASPLTLALGNGQCAIRVVNVSLNPTALGLYTTTNGTPSAALAPATSSIPFGYSAPANPYSAVNVTTLDAHTMAIVATNAPTVALGITNTNVSTNINQYNFTEGDAYTLFIYGQTGNAAGFNQLGATWVQDYPIP